MAREERVKTEVQGAAARVDATRSGLEAAARRATDYLLGLQHGDGHWCAELEGDSILESEYLLAILFLGRGAERRVAGAAETLRRSQLPGGGWAPFPGGPADVSASVKAYFVLKLLGDDPDSEPMARARRAILERGGLHACNSFTRLYLSIFGQYDWGLCPAVPPELVLLPRWLPVNIYDMSSWSRTIVVPLSIIWALKPSCEVPADRGLEELRIPRSQVRPEHPSVTSVRGRLWAGVFRAIDRLIHATDAVGWRPMRERALRRAESWILERLEKSDGLGAIFPPIVNTIFALKALGYADDDPILQSQVRELEKLELTEGDTVRLQPCFSPVWDTALALHALAEALPPEHPALTQAAEWLAEHEVTDPGDWRVKNPRGPVGGWYFEYANEFYPDCDDTAQILTALDKIEITDPALAARVSAACDRGLAWLLSMQNRDGGWAAFDRGCNRRFLTFIPFADHNAMIDPSTSDVTARAIDALLRFGFQPADPAVRQAVAFLWRQQEPDGTWYGRWGCNYVYGTWLALSALATAGEAVTEGRFQRAADWLESCQNADGGWGESPASYDDPALKGVGESTASQTAWALLGLLVAERGEGPAARRGLRYLLASQRSDGGWREEGWTGTGFPKVFYLRYHLYATYFPLLALAAYGKLPAAGDAAGGSER